MTPHPLFIFGFPIVLRDTQQIQSPFNFVFRFHRLIIIFNMVSTSQPPKVKPSTITMSNGYDYLALISLFLLLSCILFSFNLSHLLRKLLMVTKNGRGGPNTASQVVVRHLSFCHRHDRCRRSQPTLRYGLFGMVTLNHH